MRKLDENRGDLGADGKRTGHRKKYGVRCWTKEFQKFKSWMIGVNQRNIHFGQMAMNLFDIQFMYYGFI